MDELMQEALSRKYSAGMVLLLRLSSGEIAGFNAKRELIGVFTNLLTAFNEVTLNKPIVLVEPVKEPETVELDLDKYNL